jgi:hypothetical protein
MPDLVNLFDTIEIRTVTYTPTQVAINVLHYLCLSVTGTPPDLTGVAQAFNALFATSYKQFMGGNASYRGVTAKRLTPIQSIAYPYTASAGPATGSSSVLPTQVAGIITIRTRFGGSGYRGRIFLPFVGATGSGTDGAPNAGIQTVWIAIAAAMGPSVTVVGGLGQCILQQVIRKRGGIMTADPQVVGYTVQPKFGTQKRRGQYGQPNVLPF